MFTDSEKKYLKTIFDSKKVKIVPFSQKLQQISKKVIEKINSKFPELSVTCLGSSALGISGQGDVDIYILSSSILFTNYLPWLKENYGNPSVEKNEYIEWRMSEEGVPVTLYLTDSSTDEMERQLSVNRILSMDSRLREEYEELKKSFDGKSYKEYQKAKYDFYHKILNEK